MILFPKSAARNPGTKPKALAELARSADPDILELVAGNASTPRGVLETLGSSSSARVRAAVASNPSAGADLLEKLSRDSDTSVKCAVAANEATSPKILGDLARRASAEVRRAVAGNRATPLSLRTELSQSPELWEILISTGSLESPSARASTASRAWGSGEARRLLAYDMDEDVRRALASSSAVEEAVLDILVNDRDPRVASVALAARSRDGATLKQMVETDDVLVLSNLSRNPATPAPVRSDLARRLVPVADDQTLSVIARDSATPPEVLQQLARHRETSVRNCVARNPQTPSVAIYLLAADANVGIRTSAAASAALPLRAAILLAGDSEAGVRREVARNSCAPPEILARLAGDDDLDVLEQVARNRSTPATAFRRIFATYNAAREGLGHPASQWNDWRVNDAHARQLELLTKSLQRTRRVVAQNPSAPPDVLADVARAELSPSPTRRDPSRGIDYWVDPNDEAREQTLRMIAVNPSTPLNTLKLLSGAAWVADRTESEHHSAPMDEGGAYRVTVYSEALTQAARNEVVAQIKAAMSRIQWKEGADHAARLRFAQDDSTAGEILADLASDESATVRRAVAANDATPFEAIRRLATDSSAEVRLAVAASGRAPAQALLHLAADPLDEVRLAVAASGRAPAQALVQLAADPSPEVRLAAAGSAYPQGRNPRCRPDWEASELEGYRQAVELLIHDEVPTIRAAAVASIGFWSLATSEARGQLAFDPDPLVRTKLVQSYLRYLESAPSTDDHPLPPAALTHLVDTGGVDVWRALARSRHAPKEVLARLAEVSDQRTRLDIAKNASMDTLVTLARGTDAAVLAAIARRNVIDAPPVTSALAKNPNAPADLLADLAKRTADEETLRSLVLNPATPTELLLRLAKDPDPRRSKGVILSHDTRVHALLAANPAASADVLQQLADSGDLGVRESLLLNPRTPPEVLARLIEGRHC